jgi:hypothetical protein
VIQNLAMRRERDGGEITSLDARGLVVEERIEHITAGARVERQAQGFAESKVGKSSVKMKVPARMRAWMRMSS